MKTANSTKRKTKERVKKTPSPKIAKEEVKADVVEEKKPVEEVSATEKETEVKETSLSDRKEETPEPEKETSEEKKPSEEATTTKEEVAPVKEPEEKTVEETNQEEESSDSGKKKDKKKPKKEDTQQFFAFGKKRKEVPPVDPDKATLQRQIPMDIERFTPDATQGLTDEQVAKRVEEGMTNASKSNNSKSIGRIIYDNVVTYFNMLLLAIAIVLLVFQQYMQLTFLVIAIVNTIIGIVQEINAKRTIDKLRLVTSSQVEAVRNGKNVVISTDELVLDDIYHLHNGDQIPADSILLEGKIEVNESLLTGESRPVPKNPGDKIFAGSFVVSGATTVRADLIGEYSYVSGIQAKAKELSKPKSEIVRSLNGLIKVIGIIIIPLGGFTFWTQWMYYWNQAASAMAPVNSWNVAVNAVKATAGSMVGMIPSGMYLLTSIALASSIVTLSKKNALVQDLYSVEMLARVNVLCLDKTGTLTDGTMKVDEILMIDSQYEMPKLMGSYLNAFPESNQTSIALTQRYPLRKDYAVLETLPFSSAKKYSAVEFNTIGTFLLGAPEYLYKGKDKTLLDYISQKEANGYRVVMLCHASGSIQDGKVNGNIAPVAVFTLEDHIREEAPATIDWFVNNGVEIKIISGDNPLTASEIAKKCHVPHAEQCISLEGLNETEVADIVNKYTVFGRVSPEQKAIIVKELKKQGKTAGMTGDGVNDILAMKNADCSVAMANGSSAARNAANLVLLDSNFASMPLAVQQGRRAINNIQRSSALYLMKTIFTIVFTIIVLLTYLNKGNGIKYPFDPNNLLVTEMICIGFVSVFLAVQKNDSPITGHFLRNTFARAIPAAFCLILAIGMNYVLGYVSGNLLDLQGGSAATMTAYDEMSFRTLNSLTMTAIALGMAYSCCKPMFPLSNSQNRYRTIMYTITIFFVCIMVFVFGSIPATSDKYISLCDQFVGIDFHYLNKTMWLLIIIYLTGGGALLNALVHLTESPEGIWGSKKKETTSNPM